MKLHQESVQRCVGILRNVGSPLEWERTVPGRVNEDIAAMQRHVDQSIRLMNENAQQTLDLMETGIQMHETDFDMCEEDGDIWSHALNAMQANVQIVRQANARVLESWRELTKDASWREVMR
jgi:low affinity Fe/Cu permease